MPDQILISGIRGTGHHGVFAEERRDGQEFIVDVALDIDASAAAGSDDLADTVDYGEVAVAVHGLITGEPVDLIETLAERVAARCLAFPGVRAVEIALHKPEAPVGVPCDDVILRIVRESA